MKNLAIKALGAWTTLQQSPCGLQQCRGPSNAFTGAEQRPKATRSAGPCEDFSFQASKEASKATAKDVFNNQSILTICIFTTKPQLLLCGFSIATYTPQTRCAKLSGTSSVKLISGNDIFITLQQIPQSREFLGATLQKEKTEL